MRGYVEKITRLNEDLGAAKKLHNKNLAKNGLLNHEDVFQALYKLGKTMADKKRVPGFPPSSMSSTATTVSARSQPLVSKSEVSEVNTDSLHSGSSTGHYRRASTMHRVLPFANENSNESRNIITPSSIAVQMDNISPHAGTPPSRSSREATGGLESRDYVAARGVDDFIRVDPSEDYKVEPGYIMLSSESQFVAAKLNPDLGENIITQSLVTKLGLSYEPLDQEGAVGDTLWIQVGNGKPERCLGKVSLQWTTGRETCQPAFPVHCWVCVHASAVGDLVLGRPFVEKKAHYAKGKQRL
jgi:hypothetical protein